MGGELGNESNIDVLLLIGSSATPPSIFASIENDSFVAKFKICVEKIAFLRFRRSMMNNSRSSRKIKMS